MNRPDLKELQELRRMREEYLTAASRSGRPQRKAGLIRTPAKKKAAEAPEPAADEGGTVVLPDEQLPVRTGLLPGYRPSEAELLRYHRKWEGLQVYVEHEEALNMLFQRLDDFKVNTSLKHVIVKCAVLNDFYATNIFQIEPVAKRIVSIADFDKRLTAGDPTLVDEIATIEGFPRIYSFATKYCAHHNPAQYPIYDRYVADVLCFLRKQYPAIIPFDKREQLKDFPVFKAVINAVMKEFGLEKYSFKDVDRYLWQLGKDYYNPYVKSSRNQ